MVETVGRSVRSVDPGRARASESPDPAQRAGRRRARRRTARAGPGRQRSGYRRSRWHRRDRRRSWCGHCRWRHRHRLRRRGGHCGPGRDPGRAGRAAPGRQRGRRGGGRRGHARGHRTVLGRHRWRRVLRLLPRPQRAGVHSGRARVGTRRDGGGRLRRPGDRPAVRLRGGAGEWPVGRCARHPRHLGDGGTPLGHPPTVDVAAPGRPGRRERVRGRPDVPERRPGQRGGVRAVRLDQPALPARRPAARDRLGAAQPGPR
jgi:hypothetical protein